MQGYREAGRRAGAQLHRDHPDLPGKLGRGARAAAGTAGTCDLNGIDILSTIRSDNTYFRCIIAQPISQLQSHF